MTTTRPFEPKREWLDGMAEVLEPYGIERHDTVDTLEPKLRVAGLTVEEQQEIYLLGRPSRYFVKVSDATGVTDVWGHYESPHDYAEAIIWAAAIVLQDRKPAAERAAQRLASRAPDIMILTGCRPEVDTARRSLKDRYPMDWAQHPILATLAVDDEVVLEVEMPALRGSTKWSSEKERSCLEELVQCAMSFDRKGRVGTAVLTLYGPDGAIQSVTSLPSS